jgi:hypothetical protein
MMATISAATEKTQYKNITQRPSPLFLLRKHRKKTMDNISDKYAILGSNALILHQI